MPIGYRALLTASTDPANWSEVENQVEIWLTSKGLEAPGVNESQAFGDRVVSFFKSDRHDQAAIRWQLEEHWEEPPWFTGTRDPGRRGITSVTVAKEGDKLWIWVEVESPWVSYETTFGEVRREPQYSGTPKIVSSLMENLALSDGGVPLLEGGLLVSTEKQLDSIVENLKDPNRFAAIYLAVPPADDTEPKWREALDTFTRGTVGMAITLILDQGLTNALTNKVGFSHSVPRGGMRTFLPGVIPFDKDDSYRHKLLSPSRFFDSSVNGDLKRIIRRAQVARTAQVRLPRFLLEVDTELLRTARFAAARANLQSEQRLEIRNSPTGNSNVEPANNHEVEIWQSLAEEYASDNADLRLENNGLQEWKEIAEEFDGALYGQLLEISKLNNEVAVLRGRIASLGDPGLAFEEIEVPQEVLIPDSFEELLERVPEFSNIEYAGNPSDPLALDEHGNIQSAVAKAWNALRTLDHYASMKIEGSFDGTFTSYTRDGSHGGMIEIPAVTPVESATVLGNKKMRRQREINVPLSVDESGVVVAQSHISLQAINNSPRLYFYDATGKNGKIYIGHIGKHPKNTLTN